MSTPKPFAVGDAVAIYRGRGVPEVRRDTVASVRVLKRRTKVTLASGQVFGGDGSPWESGCHWRRLTHWDEKAETAEQFAADCSTIQREINREWEPSEAAKIAKVIRDVLTGREPIK